MRYFCCSSMVNDMQTNMKTKRVKDTRICVHLFSELFCRNAANARHFIANLQPNAIASNPRYE